MSEPRWTPGPWLPRNEGPPETDVCGPDGRLLATAYPKTTARGIGWLQSSIIEAEANARLIAAAPELYNQLAELLRHCERQFVGWPRTLGEVDARNRTVAVLAKASGETP